MNPSGGRFERAYSENALRNKLKRHAARAGRELVEVALTLTHVLRDPRTPRWARARVLAALGYFILPTDAVLDFLPAVGYADDMALLALALTTVAIHVKPRHTEEARRSVERWFGKAAEGARGPEAASV